MNRVLKWPARQDGSSCFRALALAPLFAALLAFSPSSAEAEDAKEPPEVVARVDGEALGRDALLEEAAAQLSRVEAARAQCQLGADKQEHQAWENGVERLVRKRLLDLEATKRGISEAGIRAELEQLAGVVSDEDVDAFYEKNKSQIRKQKEAVSDQIRTHLLQQRLQVAENDFIAGLKESYSVDYYLEPMRSVVADAGFPQRGLDSSPITIVEFSDFECPYCQRVLPTIEQIEEKYGDKIKLVFRQYPLSIHANAPKAAEASLCASDQGKFWEMHDLMFAEQENLTIDDLKDKASRLELDDAAFSECLDSGRHAAAVTADLQSGTAAGVSGTPAFFVNGRLISGAVPFETLAEVIEDELRRAGGS